MTRKFRIGVQLIPSDPFWIQVRMAIEQQAHKAGLDLISFVINNLNLPEAAYPDLLEELLAEEIDAFIMLDLPEPLIKLILDQNIPIIALVEHLDSFKQIGENPRLVSPLGLYDSGQLMSKYLAEKMQGQGTVLVIGGMTLDMGGRDGVGEDGRNLIRAIFETLAPYGAIKVTHMPTSWSFDWAYPEILAGLQKLKAPPDVIFGLSDTLALAGRAAAEQIGWLTPHTLIVGNNGDPQALAAIAEARMTATIEHSTINIGKQVVELALRAASGKSIPLHYNYESRLITAQNVIEVAARKLIEIAEMPDYLIKVNQQREHLHMTQLVTGLAINRQLGAVTNRHQLNRTIVNLLRSNYNYDRVHLHLWSETDKALVLDGPVTSNQFPEKITLDDADNAGEILAQVLKKVELLVVVDMHNNPHFQPDPRWPKLRSRVVLPVRVGEKVLGILDLQRDYVSSHSREQLMGLQLLADQLALALCNSELYNEAVIARGIAEKADKLKTRLLATVSHELRTPLNIILGYTKSALSVPNSYGTQLPAELINDLGHVYHSGEYLVRLINDLLDLSRAEIDELEISPELIDVKPFLEEIFHSSASMSKADISEGREPVKWQFVTPPHLPLLQADPLRLRQILLNLLSNAHKFTRHGHITLGVELQPPFVHIWVEDTGSGIAPEQQEQIFEPFMVGKNSDRHSGGIGLGLTISRRLVILHQGYITVESKPTKGSTFHVYLPLPNLSGKQLIMPPPAILQSQPQLNLVCISNRPELPPEVKLLGRQDNMRLYQLRPAEVREQLFKLDPSILAWDSATALENDWLVMDYLRTTPQFAQLPLMLYSEISFSKSGDGNLIGTTNILLKPFSGQTLQTLLEVLRLNQIGDGVLIIDDDTVSLDLYQQMVKVALPGMTIHRAESGQKALALLKELVPDLVIVDLVMPEVDGSDVVAWLRTNPPTHNVPVLVVSGKVLSYEHIARLDFARVALHSKDILHPDETVRYLQQAEVGTAFLPQYNSKLVKRAVAYLQTNYTRSLSIQEIAQEIGSSKNILEKNFRQELKITPWEYLNRYRIKEAKRLLEITSLSITEVASRIGFNDPAYFSRIFRAQTGLSPKEYRNKISI